MNEIDFNSPLAHPTDSLPASYSHKGNSAETLEQAADSEEYLCGQPGPAHPYANPGRDQDRSRADECVEATPFARYVG